jgi:hypothetical protein
MMIENVILQRRWWRVVMRVGVDGMLHLFERRLLTLLLLAKDVDDVL